MYVPCSITFLTSLKEPQLLPRVHLLQLGDALHLPLERRPLLALAPLRLRLCPLTFRGGIVQRGIQGHSAGLGLRLG